MAVFGFLGVLDTTSLTSLPVQAAAPPLSGLVTVLGTETCPDLLCGTSVLTHNYLPAFLER